jgi:hypothetical protein
MVNCEPQSTLRLRWIRMGMLLVTVQKLIPMPIAPSHLLAGLLAPALAKELAEPETGRKGEGAAAPV